MQARGQHSSITTAQHSSPALPHQGLWVCSPPCHLPKPGAGPMLTQPASKLQVTHGTPTWIYTQSDTGDHQPSHIGEEQEMGNKHWNGWFWWNVERTLFPWRHCPEGLCSLCPWKLNDHRTKPRVSWPDPAADPSWSRRLEFRPWRSLPAWVVLWSPETRRVPKNARFLGQAIFVTRHHQWMAYWTANADETILIKIRLNMFAFLFVCFK